MLSAKRGKNQQATEALNGGWAKYTDEDTGYEYYYNAETDDRYVFVFLGIG